MRVFKKGLGHAKGSKLLGFRTAARPGVENLWRSGFMFRV